MLRPLLLLSLLSPVLSSAACKSRDSKPPDVDHAPIETTDTPIPKKAPDAALDLYGDALPDGAMGRLGSLRMVDRSIRQMVFTPDGSQVVSGI